MNNFLLRRPRHAVDEAVEPPQTKLDTEKLSAAIAEAQAITSSAIFAMLVSKGILSALEASEFMVEIGTALRRDVDASFGRSAAGTLESYAAALKQI